MPGQGWELLERNVEDAAEVGVGQKGSGAGIAPSLLSPVGTV